MSRNVIQGFFSVLGGQAGVVAITIFLTPLLTRGLGSANYGDYAFLTSSLGLLMIIVNAGIFDGVRKYISEPRELATWESDVFAFYSQLGVVLILLVSGLIVLAVEIGLVSQLVGSRFELYFYILAVLLGTLQLSKIVRSGLMGFGLEHYSESLKVVDRLIFCVLALTAVWLEFDVAGVLVGQVISTAVITVLALWLLRPHISYRRLFARVPSEFPRTELLSYNALTTILVGLTASLYHVDVILLQPFVGSQQTGYYKIALVAAEFLWLVPFSLQIVLLHSTSEMWVTERYDHITQIATRATRYGLLLTLLLAIGLASLADPFLPLYFGAEYDAAITPLLLLLPGALGFGLARPIFGIGQGKGELRLLIVATGSAALLNLCLNLLLIPRYGMNGAAVATSLGYGSMLLLHIWCARKLGFDPIADLRLPKILLTAAISAPVIYGLSRLISGDILALTLVPVAGFLVYTSCALWTGAVRREELKEISDRLPDTTTRHLPWL